MYQTLSPGKPSGYARLSRLDVRQEWLHLTNRESKFVLSNISTLGRSHTIFHSTAIHDLKTVNTSRQLLSLSHSWEKGDAGCEAVRLISPSHTHALCHSKSESSYLHFGFINKMCTWTNGHAWNAQLRHLSTAWSCWLKPLYHTGQKNQHTHKNTYTSLQHCPDVNCTIVIVLCLVCLMWLC